MKILRLIAIATLLAGCGTKELSGVREYREITTEGLSAVQNALRSLDQVSAHTDHISPKILADFEQKVQRLQVDSLRIRARSQSILARGDAYFAHWPESATSVKDPAIRELADFSHTQLEASFSKIKNSSHQAGAAFRPFLAGLQKLRIELETKPDAVQAGAMKDLILETHSNGQLVVQELESINSELNAITSLLTPTKPEPLNWR